MRSVAGLHTTPFCAPNLGPRPVSYTHLDVYKRQEQGRGDDRIGTTLKGIGPAYADKARRIGVRAGDVLDPAAFANTVKVLSLIHI